MAEEQESLSEFVTRQFDEATAPIREHADAALQRLGRLDTLAPRKPGVHPEWAYHSGYLRQRIGDIRLIVDRLFAAQWEVVQLHVARRGTEKTGGTLDPRELTLPDQMRLDFECLYVVGNLALDQWAMLATSLAGDLDRAPSGADFAYLVNQLQGATYAGALRPLWAQHHADFIWLFFNLRFVRNCFIEHVRVERHHWRVSGGYTPHFELAMPAAIRPGQPLPISAEDARVIQDFARRFLDIPGGVDVEQESVTFLLQSLLNSIEAVPEQVDREGIGRLAERIGIQTPSYHIVARRLLQFLDGSLETLTDIIFA